MNGEIEGEVVERQHVVGTVGKDRAVLGDRAIELARRVVFDRKLQTRNREVLFRRDRFLERLARAGVVFSCSSTLGSNVGRARSLVQVRREMLQPPPREQG